MPRRGSLLVVDLILIGEMVHKVVLTIKPLMRNVKSSKIIQLILLCDIASSHSPHVLSQNLWGMVLGFVCVTSRDTRSSCWNLM